MKRRYKILINYILGPLLFIVLSYSIYRKVIDQPDVWEVWQKIKSSYAGWHLWAVVVLSIVNWGIEAHKWRILVAPIQQVSLFKAFKSVLSGLALSLFIPNRIGEYFGRVLYMDEGNRLRSVGLTFVAGFSQLIITLTAGTIGLFYLQSLILSEDNTSQLKGLSVFWLHGLLFVISGGTLFLILMYYKLSLLIRLLEKIPIVTKYKHFIQPLEDFKWRELTKILLLSAARFVVFIVQYLLMLYICDIHISTIAAIWTICVLFLVLAIVPTIPMAEIGVRGEASVRLFGLYSANKLGIVFTACGIWLINLIIPALAGSLFILSVKLFKKTTKPDTE